MKVQASYFHENGLSLSELNLNVLVSLQEVCMFSVVWSNSSQFNFLFLVYLTFFLILYPYLFTQLLFKTSFYGIMWKEHSTSLYCRPIGNYFRHLLHRHSIFWALKLIFLILAFEDPECAPCPIAWDYTVTPTTDDVETAAFRASEMAASGASARIDFVEVVLPNYIMKPNIFDMRPADGGCLLTA